MITIVPPGSAYVVERLGRYRATLQAGAHLLVPVIDRVAFKFSLAPKEGQLTDVCITLDNNAVSVKSNLSWQIIDAERAAYASASVADFVTTLVRTTVRQWIAERRFDDVRETTRELQGFVLRSADPAAAATGVTIIAFNVQKIERA